MPGNRVAKVLEFERLTRAKAIEEQNKICEEGIARVKATVQRGGAIAAEVRASHVARAKAVIEKFLEIRKESLRLAPELASPQHFQKLTQELEQTVESVCKSIPEHIRRHCGRTGLVHTNDAEMQLKAFARREVAIMKQEFELQSAQPTVTPMIQTTAPIPKPDPRRVFVVHGRNLQAQDAMFTFLRAIGLDPIEWSEAVALTRAGTPFNGEVLDHAFSRAKAVVVLLTGDDVARLGTRYQNEHDQAHERELTPQARPNVLFEAGMAFGRHPEQTILVSLGQTRPFSDVAGRNEIRISNRAEDRQGLAGRLKSIDCDVRTDNRTDWLSAGDFDAANQSPDSTGVEETGNADAANLDAKDTEFFNRLRQTVDINHTWIPEVGSIHEQIANRLVKRGLLELGPIGGYRISKVL